MVAVDVAVDVADAVPVVAVDSEYSSFLSFFCLSQNPTEVVAFATARKGPVSTDALADADEQADISVLLLVVDMLSILQSRVYYIAARVSGRTLAEKIV